MIHHFSRGFLFGQKVAEEIQGLFLNANIVALTVDTSILLVVADLLKAVADAAGVRIARFGMRVATKSGEILSHSIFIFRR